MNYAEQVAMFKDSIPIGKKQTFELVDFLKNQVDVREIKLNDLPGNVAKMVIFNAVHCILNNDLQLNSKDMSFLVFQIIKNEKSYKYFTDKGQRGKFVYIVFEEHTGYISSNSNQLFLEFELARGVTQHEFDTEGNQFRSLISHLAIDYCEEKGIKD